jgi:RimJ/RimL family protein N-acetyltransferase
MVRADLAKHFSDTFRMSDEPLATVSLRAASAKDIEDIGAGMRPATGWARDFPQRGDVAATQYALKQATGENFPWSVQWLIIADSVVAGTIGFKGEPVANELEVGYGVAPSFRRRGVASEALRQLLETVSGRGLAVKAETASWNVGSQHVVKKLGFSEVGRRMSEADGELIMWRRAQN